MFWIFVITLVGVSFSPLLFPKLDIWHAQGIWVQTCILILFSWSFFEIGKEIRVQNKPLGILNLWLGLLTAFICYKSQAAGKYNIQNFFPYFNFLCLLIFYRLVIQHLDKQKIIKLMSCLKWTILVTLFMCVLQKFGLSQFFALLAKGHSHFNNIVSGFLGNGTHLSGFLASSIPLFLYKSKREDVLAIVFIIILLFFTGTTLGDPAISGFVITIAILLVYFFVYNRKMTIMVLLAVALMMFLAFMLIEDKNRLFIFFYPQGRIEPWMYYWKIFKVNTPITGVGLGKINQLYKVTPFPDVRHLHLEYFQFMFEAGILAFLGICYMIYDFFKRKSDCKEQFILKLMVMGFCLSCLFTYPAHLWLPSTIAMFAYASFYSIENEKYIKRYL